MFIKPVLAQLGTNATISTGIPGAPVHGHSIPRVFGWLDLSGRMTRCAYGYVDAICRCRFIGVYSLQRSHDGFPAIEPPPWTLIQFFRNRAHHDDPLAGGYLVC
jgi:hypothetical protein